MLSLNGHPKGMASEAAAKPLDKSPPARRGQPVSIGYIDGLVRGLAVLWVLLMAVGVIRDQIVLLPPRPPTPAETAAARPQATANWAVVYRRLAARLPPPTPPEVGAVWATRTGQICGLVDDRESAVDNMTPFYTIDLKPVLRSDDEAQYIKFWLKCRYDHWVDLHFGTEQTGLCATRRGQSSVIGRLICAPSAPPRPKAR